MDYTGIDGIKIGGEGSAPVDSSNFVAGVAAAEGVAGVAIAIPITNYCAKTVTVNNGSTLYNYVDGARIVVKPAATVYNYAANSAASVKITGSNGRDDIHNSGANSTIEEGDGSDEIRIGVPSADKTVVLADFDSSDTLFVEDFYLKYSSRDYDAAARAMTAFPIPEQALRLTAATITTLFQIPARSLLLSAAAAMTQFIIKLNASQSTPAKAPIPLEIPA